MIKNQINKLVRFESMFVDHFIMTLIAMVFCIPLIVSTIAEDFKHVSSFPLNQLNGPAGNISLLGFALYFCKDAIGGQSIAKRLFKLQVVNASTAGIASPLQCVIRNIFCLIWPIEVVVSFISPARRIGDFVAHTRLIRQENRIQTKINPMAIGFALVLSYLITLVLKYLTVS